jgi:transposase
LRVKHHALVEALTGRFDDHHGELARMLLDQIDALTGQIDRLTARIEQLIAAIPTAQGVDADGSTGPGAGLAEGAPVLPAVDRLDEITGIGRDTAGEIIAEIGLDMTRSPHSRAPGVVGEAVASHHSVRREEPLRAHRQGQSLPQGRARRGRRRGRSHRHLPQANATGGSSNAGANSRPWSR